MMQNTTWEDGLNPRVARPMPTTIEPDGARWSDGSFERVDSIIRATRSCPGPHPAPHALREAEGGVRVEDGRAVRCPGLPTAG